MPHRYEKALEDLLWVSSKLIGTKTFFVSEIEETFKVIKVFNQNGCLLTEDVELLTEDVVWSLINCDGREPLIINDTSKDERLNNIKAVKEANVGSYLGMPVYLSTGKMFGTICAIDPEPYAFSEEEIETIKRLSSVLSATIENATISSYNEFDDKWMRLEKLSMLGQLSAGLAHELCNPMQSVKGFIQYLFKEDENNHMRDIVLSEIDRMNQVINDFLLVTQPAAPRRQFYNLRSIIVETVEALKNEADSDKIPIIIDSPELTVFVDKSQIRQVLYNVLKNAIEACEEEGQVRVNVTLSEEENIVIEVIDNGCGVPVSILGRIGDPFFTTKDKGTGLGLSIAKRIIQEHKGTIHFENRGVGTKVIITMPLDQ